MIDYDAVVTSMFIFKTRKYLCYNVKQNKLQYEIHCLVSIVYRKMNKNTEEKDIVQQIIIQIYFCVIFLSTYIWYESIM